ATAFSGRKSSTFFYGAQGSEVADYSYNYANNGTDIKTISVNYYGSGLRANDSHVGPTDALARSDSYTAVAATISGIHTISDIQDTGATAFAGRKSSTFFYGAQGSEVADYSYNYAKNGTDIKTISVNYYGSGLRANDSHVGPTDALARSDSYTAVAATISG